MFYVCVGGGVGGEIVSTSPAAIMRVMLNKACLYEVGTYVCTYALSPSLFSIDCQVILLYITAL